MTTSTPGKRAQNFVASRVGGAWCVVDSRTSDVVELCGAGATGAAAAQHRANALNVTEPRSAPAAELRAWRQSHALTLAALSAQLGVHWITLQRWETGRLGIPPFLGLALERLEQKESLS